MVKSVLWGRESILSAPKSYPSLLEIGSRTERLGVPRKRLILSSISRFSCNLKVETLSVWRLTHIMKGVNVNFKQLDFAVCCIGLLASRLGMNQSDVYDRLKKSGVLDGYIVEGYEPLHTFSSDCIADDLIGYMKEKGVLS